MQHGSILTRTSSLLLVLTASCAGTRHAGHLGYADLSRDYRPVDGQVVLGWSMTPNHEESALGYEVGIDLGYDTQNEMGVDVSSTNLELYGGPRYEFVIDEVRPWIAGGVSLLNTEVEGHQGFVTVSDDDTTIGLYLGAGLDFDVSDKVFLGIGVRRTFLHEPTLYGYEGDGEYLQVLARVGASL